jgi:hypothetical protein
MREDQSVAAAIEKERAMLSCSQGKPQFKYAIVQMLRIRRSPQLFMDSQSLGPSQNLRLIPYRQFFQAVKERASSVFQPDTANRQVHCISYMICCQPRRLGG